MSEVGQKIIASVRAHAAADPGFIYEAIDLGDETTCVYVKDGCPSCIVGKGLWDAGVIDATIEEKLANKLPFTGFNKRLFPVIDDLDERELTWLGEVQMAQDAQTPWGIAVDTADTRVTLPA